MRRSGVVFVVVSSLLVACTDSPPGGTSPSAQQADPGTATVDAATGEPVDSPSDTAAAPTTEAPTTPAPTTPAPTTTSAPELEGTPITVTVAGEAARFDVTPEEGGMVALPLGDAGTATLVVPPGAVDAFEVIELIPVVGDNGDYGVLLEPAGVWLSEPATLRFEGLPGEPLARVELATSWYTKAATTPDGGVPVVRLRPFLQSTQPDAAVEIDFQQRWEELVSPRLAMVDESEVDPFDLAAAKEEHDAAVRMVGPSAGTDSTSTSSTTSTTEAGGGGGGGGGGGSSVPPNSAEPGDEGTGGEGEDGNSEDRETETRDRAREGLGGGGGGGGGGGSCGDAPSDTQRTVERARTAGNVPIDELPDCIELGLSVYGQLTFQAEGRTIQETLSTPSTTTSVQRDCGGFTCGVPGTEVLPTGPGSLEGSTTELPLDGEIAGISAVHSLQTTGFIAAMGMLFNFPTAGVDETSCSASRLIGGSVAVTVTVLPDRQLRIELKPTPGTYDFTCDDWLPFSSSSIYWDTVGPMLNRAGTDPYRFQVPATRNVANIKDLVQDVSQTTTSTDSRGRVTYSDGYYTLSAILEVRIDYKGVEN